MTKELVRYLAGVRHFSMSVVCRVYTACAVHCTYYIITHQSGSHFTTCIFHVHHSTYCK